MKNKIVLAILLASLTSIINPLKAFGKEPADYGPESKRFGIGLYLGEPTGFTGKGYLTDQLAIQGILSWSFVDDAFTIIGDVTYDVLDIPVDVRAFTLPFYIGAGVKVGINGGKDDNTLVGIRVPLGVAMQFVNHPVEVFFEIAPGVGVAPETDFDISGGVGGRFYF